MHWDGVPVRAHLLHADRLQFQHPMLPDNNTVSFCAPRPSWAQDSGSQEEQR